MYGLRPVGAVDGEIEYVKVTAGAAIAKHDPVTLKTDGQAELSGTGAPIYGIALEAASGSGVEILVARAPRLLVLGDSDETGDAMAADCEGGRVDRIGNSGAVLVDISTLAQAGDGTDTGQMLIRKANPQGFGFDSDTSIALLEVVERQ